MYQLTAFKKEGNESVQRVMPIKDDKRLQNGKGKVLNFTFLSHSKCSLIFFKKDIQSTNKLGPNTEIQLENFIV